MTEISLIDYNSAPLKKEDFDHICRCCLSRNTIGNIFQLKLDETFLVDVFKLFNTQVNWDDDLPKTICASCTAAVINFHNFKKMYDMSVATLQNITRDSKEGFKKNTLLLISHENHNILLLGEDIENEDIEMEENEIVEEELGEGSRNESNDPENIDNSDSNASTILEETQKSDQYKISPKKDKYTFTLPYFCKTCNKWIIATGTHKHSTPRKGSHVCEKCGKSYLQEAALKIHYRIHELMLLANEESNSITEDTTKQKKKRNFQCSCDETFTSPQDLIQHKKEKNHPDPLYKNCEICNKTLRYRTYNQHMKRTHSVPSVEKEKSFACEYCGLTFTFMANLKRHIKIHTGEKPHVCEFCGKGFIQSNSLKDHRRQHTGEKPFICDICGKGFSLKKSLEDHRRVHTGEKPFICNFCGKAFIQKTQMNIHRTVHTGEKPYLCDHCGVSFWSSLLYNNHLKVKHHDKLAERMEFQCEICDKSFSSKILLTQHMLRHEEKKFICTHCENGFHTKTELDSHLITHTGEKKIICHSCGKAFHRMLNLKMHEKIHTGLKPYSCKICFKTFRQSAHLVSHMRTHSGEKPFACSYCDKSFAHNTTKVVHERSHTGERPYVCDVCSKGFYHSSSMTKHRQTHFKNHIGTKLQEST